MTIVMSLDLGSTLGYYTNDGDKVGLNKKFSKDRRFLEFYNFLIDYSYVDTFVYEDAKFQPGNAAPVFHGFVGILKLYCLQNDKQLFAIPVKTIKKHITQNGNADKNAVMAAVTTLGYVFADHNAADAIAVYITYKDLYDKE